MARLREANESLLARVAKLEASLEAVLQDSIAEGSITPAEPPASGLPPNKPTWGRSGSHPSTNR